MSELDQVRDAWDRIAEQGNDYYLAADAADIERARSGRAEIKLTPTRTVPSDWLGELPDKAVLVLAGGGGLQGPILAAAGARTTVFDLSKCQLKRDEEVASHFGLSLETVQGDMSDLSCFDDGAFDLIVNPCSICFCCNPRSVWQEVSRVLRPGGSFLSGLINPVNYLFDFFEADRKKLVVRYTIPFDSQQLEPGQRDRWLGTQRPVEWGHSLQELIGGQLEAGLLLAGFYEDRWGDDDLLSDHLPVFFATRTVRLQ